MAARSSSQPTLNGSLAALVLQACLLIGLGAASWGCGLAILRSSEDRQSLALRETHRVEVSLDELAWHVRVVSSAGDTAQTADILDQLARLRADVELVLRSHGTPEHGDGLAELLDRVATSAAGALSGDRESRRAEAHRFSEAVRSVQQRLRAVDAAAFELARRGAERSIGILLLGSVAAVLVYAVTTVWLRGRVIAVFAAERARTRAVAVALAEQLHATVRGLPAAPSEMTPGMEPLGSAVEAARSAIERTRDTLRFEQERARFSHALAEALDLADEEAEVCSTVEHAGKVLFPGGALQLLLADNSHARLTHQLSGAPVRCSPGTPRQCPSLRRARTIVHAPDAGIARCRRLGPGRESVACATLSVHGRAVGVVQIGAPSLDAVSVERLTSICFAIGARLGVVRTLGERELAAATDVLTGLANRRAMNEHLTALDAQSRPYAVIAADLDHFKALNDKYGHEVGDRCLRIFAQVLRDASRSGDLACRAGGEEFMLILSGTDAAGALGVAERTHALLAEASRRVGLEFSVSLGVAARPTHGNGFEEVLRAADSALYSAKSAGRNCTKVFEFAAVAQLTSAA